ncbi:MAG: cation transporter [Chloroflexota bacterium]|nr:cation transporter [Chloroflexota bacterium]
MGVEARQAFDDEELDRAERRASRISAVLLVLLSLYVVGSSLVGLVVRVKPERSFSGLAVSAAALLVMPMLGWRKRVIAERIGSRALRADAAESITCAYMAGAVVLGVALHAAFGWWWVQYAAALPFLWWLVGETREAIEAARGKADDNDG